MKVCITPEFINDLRESDDNRFIRQVLNHVLEKDGSFISDADDHRYEGIEDAWIRYVSRGKTAFRVIYLKKDDLVYLYRAGTHSVEIEVKEPKHLDISIPLEKAGLRQTTYIPRDIGYFLKTLEPRFLNKEILSMYHVGHKEILLVAPFVSLEILDKFHHFGRFLDKAIEEGTEISLVTKPPGNPELARYQELDERCIFVYFLQNLHTKLYIFDINPSTVPDYCRDMTSTVIMGSSNLSKQGLSLDDDMSSEELCYRVPLEKYSEAYSYAKQLIKKADDLKAYVMRKKRS
ncbi:phospholipase D-like domain-containing protein [Chloroflexota bacterium]